MAFELRFSIEDELKIYARLLDELMKKSSINTNQTISNLTSSTIRSTGIEDHNNSSIFQHKRHDSTGGTSGIFDLASSQSGWPQTTTTTTLSNSNSAENLFQTNENEIHETYDGDSIIRSSSSFSTQN